MTWHVISQGSLWKFGVIHRLGNDIQSFHPVHSLIRAIGPHDLHLKKARGRPVPGWVPQHRAVHHRSRGLTAGWSLALGVQLTQAAFGPPEAYDPGGSSTRSCKMATPTHSCKAWTDEGVSRNDYIQPPKTTTDNQRQKQSKIWLD